MIFIPMPPLLIDVLITLNIVAAITVILVAISAPDALGFSTFPTVLLILTVFRIAITISTARLILTPNMAVSDPGFISKAGELIAVFGNFVGGGEVALGVVIFILLILVQLIVVTRGAERVSEVAARFTLDAMPGKQMAIDADLNSGVIDEAEARKRRRDVAREADFYGSMDGASKFVKGDNILGIIATAVIIIGGLVTFGLHGEVAILAIGDGLSSQIPALLISTATGIIVTKAATDESLGVDVARQFTREPYILFVGGGVLILLSFIPNTPVFVMWLMALTLITLGILQMRAQKKAAARRKPARWRMWCSSSK
jgi:flagellar biosynthesis protein FlhA